MVYGIGPLQHGSGWVTAAGWGWMRVAGRRCVLSGRLSEGCVCVRDLGLVGKGCDVRGRVCVLLGRPGFVLRA